MLLRRREGEHYLLSLRKGPQTLTGVGVVDLTDQVGAPAGGVVQWAGSAFRVLRPTLADLLAHLRRRAQIVTPKDSQYLLYLAGIFPGARVAEAGAGSGALTTVLAHAVGPGGKVVSFDRRPDFLEVARGNVAQAGYSDRVEFVSGDVALEGFAGGPFDSILLDLPEPWTALAHAKESLRVGGGIATYVPTYNQLERTVLELRSLGFEETRSFELLERSLHVGSGGTRPEFEMLGHTGFLTGARRVD